MTALLDLWATGGPLQFQAVLDKYSTVVRRLQEAARSTKKPGADSDLVALDRWYREELPGLLRERSVGGGGGGAGAGKGAGGAFLRADEHVKLINWKMQRNKARPNHLKWAKELESDGAAKVEEATRAGLAALVAGIQPGDAGARPPVGEAAVRHAIEKISVLKGVGPGAASALLAAADPSVPFMGEEAIAVTHGKLTTYNANAYILLMLALRGRAAELSAAEGGRQWTAAEVEHALFACGRGEVLDAKAALKAAPAAKRQRR